MQRCFVIVLLFLISCNTKTENNSSDNNPLSKVQLKMTKQQVIDIAGKPTQQDDYGTINNIDTITSANSEKIAVTYSNHFEKWSYGQNMEIMFTNDLVSGIDTNIVMTQQRIQRRIDSARQVERQIQEQLSRQK